MMRENDVRKTKKLKKINFSMVIFKVKKFEGCYNYIFTDYLKLSETFSFMELTFRLIRIFNILFYHLSAFNSIKPSVMCLYIYVSEELRNAVIFSQYNHPLILNFDFLVGK